MQTTHRYVVVEGLPAVGKSEILSLLARFHPHDVRVLPELVKTVVEDEGIDLFRDRDRLTEALAAAAPRRRRDVEEIVRSGKLCLEESHLGVHYAYSAALGDKGFQAAYPRLEAESLEVGELRPDLFLRLDIPVDESVARQAARGTPRFAVAADDLARFRSELDRWHATRRTPLVVMDAHRAASDVVCDLEAALGLSYRPSRAESAPSFDVLLLLGRPASGKSEFIDFMRRADPGERASRFHIGTLSIVDDFPILWRVFEDDDAWERTGAPRRHSRRADGNYAVSDGGVWAFLIERINDATQSWRAPDGSTLLVEFSRGGRTGYRDALSRINPRLLSRAAALYLDVSFEESWRRNVARYDEKRKSGVLTHSVPREEMETTYGMDDWAELTGGRASGHIAIGDVRLPFVTLSNEPESLDPAVLGPRYGPALDRLFALRRPA